MVFNWKMQFEISISRFRQHAIVEAWKYHSWIMLTLNNKLKPTGSSHVLCRGRNLRAEGLQCGTSTSAGAGTLWVLGFLPLPWCQWKILEQVKPLAHYKHHPSHVLLPICQPLQSQALAAGFRPQSQQWTPFCSLTALSVGLHRPCSLLTLLFTAN